ncbi:MAG: hypothetical protein ACJ74Z_14965 [Bryobacteraceae bacterium]
MSRFSASDKLAIVFCLAAVAFLLTGNLVHVTRTRLHVSPLKPIDPSGHLLSGTGFASNAVYPTTPLPAIEGTLSLFGSWLHSNRPTGSVHTPWYPPVRQFYLFVAGYPNHANNQLFAEVDTAHSGTVRLSLSPKGEPHESWSLQKILLDHVQQPARFRIVAADSSTAFWLGFSQPFLVQNPNSSKFLKELCLIVLVTAASFVAFLSPGLLLRQKLLRFAGRRLPFIFVSVPGLLLLALLGLASWVGPQQFTPCLIARAGLWILALYAGYQFFRVPISSFTSATERRVLLMIVVLAAIAIAKSTYSIGPVGELYHDEVSRTLEVGGRSDSRVAFNIVQLVALRKRPFSPFAHSVYETWNFSERGPITGLAATPVVLASPVQVPTSIKSLPWVPFDPEGFTAYRIAMIVIACCSLLPVFALATLFLSNERAFFAFLVAVTAPFVVHETYFTWAKLPSASFVLTAGYLVVRSRYLLSGVSLGVGYLCHPSALVWFPCLFGVLVLTAPPFDSKVFSSLRKIYLWTLKTVSMLAGVAICVLLWKRLNGRHFSQAGFHAYVVQSWTYVPTPLNWLRSRFQSLANTLVPLHVFIFDRSDPYLNSMEGPSPPVVQFFLQYWDTLPFGSGIAFFCCALLRLLYVALWKARAWLLMVFVIPFTVFTVYWGASISGMLRENLHAWFLGLMIFAVIVWKKHLLHSQRFWQICNWALLFRGLEILLMLLLPSLWTQGLLLKNQFALTDSVALLIMISGTVWLSIYTFSFAEKLRMRDVEISENFS